MSRNDRLDSRARALDGAPDMALGPNITLQEGDQAPAFTAQTSGGGKVSLKEFLGRHVVLFFYPKDDTPG